MNILKQTKRNTLSLIISIIAVSMLIGYSFLKYQFKISINEQLDENYKSIEKLFNRNIEHDKEKFTLELDAIVSIPGLSKAVARQDHTQLEYLVSEYYTNLKKIYPDIKTLTFHSSDDITIYRAHKPELYGDKASEKTKLITDTDKFEKSFSGFEVGGFEVTYRVTYPIFNENRYVGNVEVGLDSTYFLTELSDVFNLHAGLLIEKSLSSLMLNPESISVDNEHVLLNADKAIQSYFLTNKGEQSNFIYNEKLLHVKNNIPLLNHEGKTLGYLVIGIDKEKIIDKNNLFIYRFFGLVLIMMMIAGFVMSKGFQKILDFFTEQIYIDQLTGLKNRIALNELLILSKKHVLILSDIKDFSIINELYGAQVGNEVLKYVGTAFSTFADEHGFQVFRIASDEYILYKEDEFFDPDDYSDTLELLHTTVSSLKIAIAGIIDIIRVDINSGIVFDDEDSLEKVQMALKKTKSSTSPYLAYTKNVDTKEKSETILQIKSAIRKGLETNNIVPFFQPITDNMGNITKYESLIRIVEFNDGIKNIISPDSFIAISKQGGFYTEISKRMIESSLLFFRGRDEKISINLSPGDLFNTEIMDTLIENIKQFDTPSRIVIEITEQDSLENFDRFVHGINMLRRLGVLIAIDDFGSGYANYAHILVIKPDYLKIDGTLVTEIMTNNDIRILVRSIVSFAKELKIKTIAEYIETEEIFELLKGYGIDEFQGYYFGKPIDFINQKDL